PAPGGLGRARRPPPPLPGLLDRRPRQDGLQTQVPSAGGLRRPPLAPVRRDRTHMTARKRIPRRPALPALAILVLALPALAACVRVNVHGPAPQIGRASGRGRQRTVTGQR